MKKTNIKAIDKEFPSIPEDIEEIDKLVATFNANYFSSSKDQDLENRAWIQTYTGKKIFPLRPNPDDICIEDIAHALSNICRFTGHCKSFYSVAQHCVLVSYLCDSEHALAGLLHDSSEAYVCDLASPIKRTSHFDSYREIERKLQSVIYKKYGLSETEPPNVKKADVVMLATESRDLLANMHPDWKMDIKPVPFVIYPLPPKEAEKLYLERFEELNGIR